MSVVNCLQVLFYRIFYVTMHCCWLLHCMHLKHTFQNCCHSVPLYYEVTFLYRFRYFTRPFLRRVVNVCLFHLVVSCSVMDYRLDVSHWCFSSGVSNQVPLCHTLRLNHCYLLYCQAKQSTKEKIHKKLSQHVSLAMQQVDEVWRQSISVSWLQEEGEYLRQGVSWSVSRSRSI